MINKPLVGKSPHHLHSTQDFVKQTYKVTLQAGECLSSYDVTPLFTSVSVDPAMGIIKDLSEQDNTLKERAVLFCLHNTYISFQDQFYKQVEGAAMGSQVSPILANLYMEYFDQKALSTATHPLRLWLRYVDDTFVIKKKSTNRTF